ncbi:alpha-tocopherol transfer protein-like [Aethina tumida]|uniref:alpha-tocopherol transfer protein-like n=1 Tax=Aethina tumida TaxID=116153 RepID=UPI00214987DC|nr:alpha-tocopherol transfer protein-like [Aethina tumida]
MDIISISEECDNLVELKKIAVEKQLNRTDEDYLCRYLTGHENNVKRSINALCNYQSFVERRRDTWLNIDKTKLSTILESCVIDVLENQGELEQKVVWIRLEKWNPELFSADDILQISGLICEAIYSKVKIIKFIDIIMDLNNIQFQHLYALSTKFAKRMVFFLSECLPMKMLNIYIIRQPKLFYLLYAVFKPFISERMKKVIHVCGHDFTVLVENIGEKILPQDLDGCAAESLPSRWLEHLYKTRTQKDLQLSGYQFSS